MSAPEQPLFTIRTYAASDADACAELYSEGLLGGKIAENDTGLDMDDVQAAYLDVPGSHFWVAEMNDSKLIAGMIGVQHHEDNVGEIRRLRVRHDLRRRGIGSNLIETALTFCQKHGYLKITLDTYMEREPAIKLFEKFHFRHSRTREVGGKEIMHFYLDLYQRDEGRQKPEKT